MNIGQAAKSCSGSFDFLHQVQSGGFPAPENNFYGRPFIRAGTTMKLLFSFTAFWKGMRQ